MQHPAHIHLRIDRRANWGFLFLLGLIAGGAGAAFADPALREESLAARSGPRGATLFAIVDPAQSGIVAENNFADPKMWDEHYQELIFGEIGTGIAIGDYDGDGRPDVFVASKTEGCRLFRNLGGWKFEDVTESAGLGGGGWLEKAKSWVGLGAGEAADSPEWWKQGAAFADVNNDGWLDLYVCRFNAPNWLYINQGDGTFKEEAAARGLAVKDGSCMAAFCDYDRDGWLDVFIHTNMLDVTTHPHGRRPYLLRNRGDGTFEDVTERAGIRGEAAAHSAIWWDQDGDGWPDLYVANDFAPADSLYRNNRDGTFTNVIEEVLPHMPYYAMGSDIGDVNNDGRIDLLVADMAATNHEKDFRGMADARARAHEEPAGPASPPQFMRNALFLETGTGRMLEAGLLAGVAASDWTWSVRLEDLDNDGRLDLHVTNGMIREYHNADLLARVMSAGNLAAHRQIVRQSPHLAEVNVAFRNLGDLQFEKVSAEWGLDHRGVSFGAAFADLDGDGDLDLVFSNYEGGVSVLRNDSQEGHRIVVALRGTRSNKFGIGARVRIETAAGVQVRALTVARGYLSSSEPVAHFGLGELDRIDSLTVEWPSGHVQRFTDLAVDRKLTITEPASAPPDLRRDKPDSMASGALFEATAHPSFIAPEDSAPEGDVQPLLPFRFDRRGPALAAGDLDGDGRETIVIGGTERSPLQILGCSTLPSDGVDDGPLLLIDYDSDGDLDLLRTKAGSSRTANYQPRIYRNTSGLFDPVDVFPAISIPAGAAAAADFDRDGDLDVFIGGRHVPGSYPDAPRSVLMRNDAGRFVDATPTELERVGMVTAALWTDANNDGWPDLLVATEWGTLRLFINDRGTLRERKDAGFDHTGLWTSLASADFNGDGVPDYVAGNIGLNTPYRAPAILFKGDFRGDGQYQQLVEAKVENGKLLPTRARSDLGAQIPQVVRRFARNDAFARATLPEILGDALEKAVRLEATELASGVYLSQPEGTWKFTPLPRIAQIAPLQGMVTADFNGDGHTDLFAVQNLHSIAPAIGRFGGGLGQLLLGDGQGDFTPVPPQDSGLVVPGDAKALLALDLNDDGWPDMLASRNRQPSLAFMHRGVEGSGSFRVVLKGPDGNPAAVGAVLTLELTDGSTQRAELFAGSGYYSQQPPGCFFAYPISNPPKRLTVRWPDGRTTSHPLAASPPARVEIREP
ncbi:MAG TPA: FG-GAP-like repeat-containing protein [Opitutaceae bacterium]|nr:FG-GAP-like repeat-containing protein [Opitutaceae bacterium]